MATDDAGSAPEADAGSSSVPTEPAPPGAKSTRTPRHGRAASRPGRELRASWRAWRRSRPFWGGLLLILGGLELLALPLTGVLVHGAIKLVVYIGIGGVFGVLIGVLLIAAGIVSWVNPTHRVFYGIAGIVLGIISFPASNLGGFLLGMLLAIIGGALAFAWVPADAEPADAAPPGRAASDAPQNQGGGDVPGDRDRVPANRDHPPMPEGRGREPSVGLDLVSGRGAGRGETAVPEAAVPDGGGREPSAGPALISGRGAGLGQTAARETPALELAPPATNTIGRRVNDPAGHQVLAVAALPAVLVAGLLGTAGAGQAGASSDSGGNCILGMICLPSSTPTPTATATPTPTPTPSASGSASRTTASPAPSATTSAAPSASPSPSAASTGTASPSPSPTPSASASASPSASGKPGSSKSAHSRRSKAARKDAAAPSGLTASAATSVLSAGSATLADFKYQGIATVPVSGGGSEQMLEFTANSANLSGGVTVSVTQDGLTTVTSSPTLGFSGGMTLDATELCGNVFGVLPKCFTPTSSSTVLLSLANLLSGLTPITMTDVTTDQPLTTAGALQTGSLTLTS